MSTIRVPAENKCYVLVLLDPEEGDMLGIWGPYDSLNTAEHAREELMGWPLNAGTWDIVLVKNFPVVPPSYGLFPTTSTNTRTGNITWTNNDGDVFQP